MGKLRFRWRDTLPLIFPLFVFVGAELVLIAFANVGFAIPASCCLAGADHVTAMGDAAGRLQVVTFLAAFALAAMVTIVKVLVDLWPRIDFFRTPQFWPYVALAFAVGYAIYALTESGIWPETKTLIGARAFDLAFTASASLGSPRLWSEASLEMTVIGYGVMVLATAAVVLFGIVSCLGLPDGYAGWKPAEQRQFWYAQSERMKIYLYLGAGTLALGVLFMRAWMSYPIFIMGGDALAAERSTFNGAVNGYAGFVGMQFTAMFAVVAVPVMAGLAQRATDIASRIARSDSRFKEPPPADRFNLTVIELKEKHRLAITRDEVLKVLVPMMAPVVAGWLPGLAHVLI